MKRPKSALITAAVLSLLFNFTACGGEEQKAAVQPGPGTALVLIDLQTDYLSPKGKMPIAQDQVGPLIKAVNSLVQAAQQQAFPVMYTMDQFSQFAIFNNMGRNFAAVRYSAGQKLDPQVNDVAGPYFAKTSEDAFANSEFATHLEGLDCGNLVVAGVYADNSVLSTVQAALARGYKVTVISDAVGASSDQARDAALQQLKTAGAKVETSGEFIAAAAGGGTSGSTQS